MDNAKENQPGMMKHPGLATVQEGATFHHSSESKGRAVAGTQE